MSQSVAMLELSPKDIRSEIKRLKACIREVEATRVAPADDYWHELLDADWEAARAYGELSGRSAVVREIEAARIRPARQIAGCCLSRQAASPSRGR
jgi:hypothetical protein